MTLESGESGPLKGRREVTAKIWGWKHLKKGLDSHCGGVFGTQKEKGKQYKAWLFKKKCYVQGFQAENSTTHNPLFEYPFEPLNLQLLTLLFHFQLEFFWVSRYDFSISFVCLFFSFSRIWRSQWWVQCWFILQLVLVVSLIPFWLKCVVFADRFQIALDLTAALFGWFWS